MRATITSIGQAGDGIAEIDGERWFVPYAAPGDIADLKPEQPAGKGRGKSSKGGPKRAKIGTIVTPSTERVTPDCRHFGRCGGCALQHVSDGFLQNWKRDLIVEALSRRGFEDVPVSEGLAGAPGRRRRATFSATRYRDDRLAFGFYQRRSKQVIDIGPCPVLEPALEDLIAPLRAAMPGLVSPGDEVRVQLNLADNGVDLLLDGPIRDDLTAHETLADFANAHDIARISVVEDGLPRTILSRRDPQLSWGVLTVTPQPGAFLQADRIIEAEMRRLVALWSRDAGPAVDLFAGVGTLTSALSVGRDTLAVDSDEAAIARLRAGVDATPGADLRVAARNLFRRPMMPDELKHFSVAVLDPPAAGAKEQCEQIAASSVASVIYVSCAPASFARDVRILADAGFELVEVHPLDQFHWAADIELAALLQRR